MAVHTLSEIRSNISETTREIQIDDLIDEFINLTIQEINDPVWAFEGTRKAGYNHLWRANRRKYTLTTVSSQEYYQLPRDLDKVHLIRQTESPVKLIFVPDELFYKWIPNPTAEGNPRYYRQWEEYGVSTQLTANDTIDIVSSSTSDSGILFTVIIRGKDANDLDVTETITLNGQTLAPGSTTFSKILQVSKSRQTTGTITVTENSGGTTVVLLSPEERSPRFKRISFYPIPSSEMSVYLEYYTRFRGLVNDPDVPDFDEKWHWVIRQGALAKVYQYQGEGKQMTFATTQAIYASGVRAMVHADILNIDYIPYLKSAARRAIGITELADSIIDSGGFVPFW